MFVSKSTVGKYRILSVFLCLVLAVTQITDLNYAAGSPEKEDIIVEKTTDSTTYDLGGGKLETVFHGEDVRYEDENGNLVDYDPSLVEVEDNATTQDISLEGYAYENREGDKKHYLPEVLSEETPVILEKEDYHVHISPSEQMLDESGTKDIACEIEEEERESTDSPEKIQSLPTAAVYEEEGSTAQIRYSSLENGIKESLVLKEKPESNIFTYILDTGDLIPVRNEIDEGISFIDPKTREYVFDIAPAWMNDATGEAYSEEIRYEIDPAEETEDSSPGSSAYDPSGKYILHMIVDEGYLNDPSRKYPVTVDPAITWTSASDIRDVYCISGNQYQNTNFYTSQSGKMAAGKNSAGYLRTFISFAGFKSKVSGKSIASAYLKVHEAADSAGSQTIGAYRVLQSWNPSTIKWSNMPTYSTNLISTVTTKKSPAASHNFNLTSYARAMAKGTYTDYGIMLKNNNATPACATFCGSKYATVKYRPTLRVTYYAIPAKPAVSITEKSTSGEGIRIKYSGISSPGLKEVRYKIQKKNGTAWADYSSDLKAGKSGSGTISIAGSLSEGTYRALLYGVNLSSDAGAIGYSGELIVDKEPPCIEETYIKTCDHDILGDNWTEDNDPYIYVNGIRDNMGIQKANIKYAVTSEKEGGINAAAEESLFKAPGSSSLTEEAPYSGYIRLTKEDKELASGRYVIHVRAEDNAGGKTEKRILYCKDSEEPSGDISVTDNGREVTDLEGTVNIIVSQLSGTGGDLAETHLYLKKIGNEEQDPYDLTGPITRNTTKILDTTNYENGAYVLSLKLRDEAGHEKRIEKEVSIRNPLDAPKIQVSYGEDISYCTVNFSKDRERIEKVEYRIDDEDWQQAENFYLLELPKMEDGRHIIRVRGIDKAGVKTKEAQGSFVCDRVSPDVNITSFDRGRITGNISDENLKFWDISYARKGSDEFTEVKQGEENINGELAVIDMDDPYFDEESSYIIRVHAEDEAGNTAEDEIEITKDQIPYVKVQKAAFRIKRPAYSSYDEDIFTAPSSQGGFSMLDPFKAGGYTWYIDGEASGEAKELQKDLSIFLDGSSHSILAIREADNEKKYSSDIILNDIEKELSFTGESGEAREEIKLERAAVSFTLKAQEGFTYRIKTGEGQYTQITPNMRIYVSDISGSVLEDTFTIKAESQNEGELPEAAIYFDTVKEEAFKVSDLADYLPESLSVKSRLNDRTYVYWDNKIADEEDLSYNIYRSREKDFEISEETIAAENIRAGYFAEMNCGYACTYYYKVTVVRRGEEGKRIAESVPSIAGGGKLIDENERAKRLGQQEFWDYCEFNTAAGSGKVEQSQGNLVFSCDDIAFSSDNLETGLTRTYNSMSTSSGAFGLGWVSSLDLKLLNMYDEDEKDFSSLVFSDGTGAIAVFEKKGDIYISSEGEYLSLEEEAVEKEIHIKGKGKDEKRKISGAYVMKSSDGIEYLFNGSGQLVYLEEKSGSFMVFEYDDTLGLLNKAITNKGLEMSLEYEKDEADADTLLVKKVSMPDGSVREYEYTVKDSGVVNLLTKVTEKGKDGKERSLRYSYDEQGGEYFLDEIKDAKSNAHKIRYEEDKGKVESITDAAGSGIRLEYENMAGGLTKTAVTSYEGRGILSNGRDICTVSSTFGNETGYCMSHTDSKGKTSRYDYVDGVRQKSTYSVVERTLSQDGRIEESEELERTELTTYGKKRQTQKEVFEDGSTAEYSYAGEEGDDPVDEDLVTEELIKDADGNVVEQNSYEYDDMGNEIYCYDAVENETVISTYTESGDILTEKEYEGRGDGGTLICQSSYSYTYGDDGSLTEVSEEISDGVTTVSTVKYDYLGREIFDEVSIGGVTESTKEVTYDGFGDMVETVTDEQGVVTTVTCEYDLDGNLISESAVTEDSATGERDVAVNTFTYDAAGRVITQSFDDNGEVQVFETSYRYADVTIKDLKKRSGRTIERAFITEVREDGDLVSASYIDHEGNSVREKSEGIWTDTIYDDYGTNVGTYTAGSDPGSDEGMLTIILTDRNGNVTHRIDNPEDAGGYYIAGLDSIVNEACYDAQARVIKKIDAEGNEASYAYTSKGELESVTLAGGEKTRYQISEQKEGNVYAAVATTIDARGNRSIAKTDEQGNIREIRDKSADPADDLFTKYTYDNKGNLTRKTDSKGNQVSYDYDRKSRVRKKALGMRMERSQVSANTATT